MAAPPASAQEPGPTVMIDGSPMTFTDQPPIVRAGRIYVPMRAIFERLGATVVYDNGTINATRAGRRVQLQIGSPVATVAGQQVQLDAPPFEVAARTLVPLRFVSQALGARVSWDQSRDTAYIMTGGMGAYAPPPQAPPPGAALGMMIRHPSPIGDTRERHPTIGASFAEPLRPRTVIVRINGRDVSGMAQITPDGFQVTPEFGLASGPHRVTVTGLTGDGNRVSGSWTFTVL